jgi:hypothetical protein
MWPYWRVDNETLEIGKTVLDGFERPKAEVGKVEFDRMP